MYSIETDLDYIDIPVQAKIYFLKNVSLDLGAQVGFLLNTKGKITNSQNNNGEEVEFKLTNTVDFGLNGVSSNKKNKITI
ncbi:outer membrane beta-barrel protein [Mesonia maritima]|uniref:outer membrane beta-barrel protein n=1 Tax=Mesonia maritima TaxID=1793873 RepID=UPI00362F7074